MVDVRQPNIVGRYSVALVLTIGPVLLAGCSDASPTPPDTYAVAGQVQYRGGQPLAGGIIQFLSEAEPTLNMSSIIQPDGSFQLQTIHGNNNLRGAVQGACQVMVTLPIVTGERPEVIVLPQQYQIARQENHFVIQLDRPAP